MGFKRLLQRALPLPLATLRAIDAHDGFLFVPVDSLNGRENARGRSQEGKGAAVSAGTQDRQGFGGERGGISI